MKKIIAMLAIVTAVSAPIQNASARCNIGSVIGFSLATIFPAGAVAGGTALYVASATMDTSPDYGSWGGPRNNEGWRSFGYVVATFLVVGGIAGGAFLISSAVENAQCDHADLSALEPLNLTDLDRNPLLTMTHRRARRLGIGSSQRSEVIADWNRDLPRMIEWVEQYRAAHATEFADLRESSVEQQRRIGAQLLAAFEEFASELLPGTQLVIERLERRLNERLITRSVEPRSPLSIPLGQGTTSEITGSGFTVRF